VRAGDVPPPPVPQGAYAPSIIVLLTDGASNSGPEPVDAAQQAADRGVRVYTIGFGTPNGSALPPCGRQLIGNEPQGFGGGGFGGGGFRRGIDEETLKRVSAITDGEYYAAESSNELQQVFAGLPVSLITRHEVIEVSVIFIALGALLAGFAVVLALLWRPLG
jgi:Ca-activated chloride channel family protein